MLPRGGGMSIQVRHPAGDIADNFRRDPLVKPIRSVHAQVWPSYLLIVAVRKAGYKSRLDPVNDPTRCGGYLHSAVLAIHEANGLRAECSLLPSKSFEGFNPAFALRAPELADPRTHSISGWHQSVFWVSPAWIADISAAHQPICRCGLPTDFSKHLEAMEDFGRFFNDTMSRPLTGNIPLNQSPLSFGRKTVAELPLDAPR